MGVSIVVFEILAPPPGFENDNAIFAVQETVVDSRRNTSVSRDNNKKKNTNVVRSVCIITEYLDQGALADILYGSNKVADEIWTYELVLTCALQAARGMLYLHSHQPPICHIGTSKLSNLVVDDHWVVKVTDFGMSRIVPMKIQNIEKGIEMSDVELNAAEEAPSAPERLQLEALSSTAPLSSKKTVRFGDNSNVLCERESIISLQDGAERSSLSNLNTVMTSNLGTTAWCAPELLTTENKTRYSVKVDVCSFGIVLWELWDHIYSRHLTLLYPNFPHRNVWKSLRNVHGNIIIFLLRFQHSPTAVRVPIAHLSREGVVVYKYVSDAEEKIEHDSFPKINSEEHSFETPSI